MKKIKQLQKLAKQLVDISFSNGKMIDSKVVKSLKLLKSLPRSESIPVLTEYLKGLRRLQKQYTLYIESPIKLSRKDISKIKKSVAKRVKITNMAVNINPDLIAGIRLKIGDEIWEDSVMDRIRQVKEAIIGRYI